MPDELLGLIDIAIGVISNGLDTNWTSYESAEAFVADLKELRSGITRQENEAAKRLYLIFAPTGDWDESAGPGGEAAALSNRVCELLHERFKI